MDEQNANSLLNIQIKRQKYTEVTCLNTFKTCKPLICLYEQVKFTVLLALLDFGSTKHDRDN